MHSRHGTMGLSQRVMSLWFNGHLFPLIVNRHFGDLGALNHMTQEAFMAFITFVGIKKGSQGFQEVRQTALLERRKYGMCFLFSTSYLHNKHLPLGIL